MADTPNLSRIPIKRGQQFVSRPAGDRDTNGGSVPTWMPHAFAYDTSGNLSSDTVTDGTNTWVRTYLWDGAAQSNDSGWVKQDG